MTQIEPTVATPAALENFSSGSILSAGGSAPFEKALSADWADMVDGFQQAAVQSRLGIPLIYGVDAVHANNNVYGATIFPHNVGLGATRSARIPDGEGVTRVIAKTQTLLEKRLPDTVLSMQMQKRKNEIEEEESFLRFFTISTQYIFFLIYSITNVVC